MRLDKFLKVSRIIKRRPLAKEIAEKNRIRVNGNHAKASFKIAEDDLVEITFAQKKLTFKVLRLKEHVRKEEAATLYEVVEEEKISREE